MKQVIFMAFTLVFLLPFSDAMAQQRPTLWVVAITQNDATTTRIGSVRDGVRFRQQMEQAARAADMNLQYKAFENQDAGIASHISSLSPGTDDVVWVYYSGHGANSNSDVWPAFSGRDGVFKQGEIAGIINRKNARLKITMYDCCNMGGTPPTGTRDVASSLPVSAYVFMLRKSRGSVMACSSKQGQYSYGDPTIGGYFTDSFFKAVSQVDYGSTDSQRNIWRNVLQKAVSNTQGMTSNSGRSQVPHYDVSNVSACDDKPITPTAAPTNISGKSAFDKK